MWKKKVCFGKNAPGDFAASDMSAELSVKTTTPGKKIPAGNLKKGKTESLTNLVISFDGEGGGHHSC